MKVRIIKRTYPDGNHDENLCYFNGSKSHDDVIREL